MVCIYCGKATKVVNSRPQNKLKQVWRRRQCLNCKSLFTTTERIDLAKSLVLVKTDQKLEPFIKEKLLLSIFRSLGHRKSATSDAIAITDTVMAKLLKKLTSPLITPDTVIKQTSLVLSNFDQAANVHYLAYHPVKSKIRSIY